MTPSPANEDPLPGSLFVPVESRPGAWLPTGLARGPWSADALHGGPVAALLARAAQQVEAPVPTRLTRLTVELFGPVPFAPLLVETDVLKPGSKVSTLELRLRLADPDASPGGSDRALLAVARAQRIRCAPVDLPDGAVDHVPDFPATPSKPEPLAGATGLTFHADAVEHRFTFGGFGESGPALDWIRLKVPVVPGEEPSGWQRAAAVADFTNGLSAVTAFDGSAVFVNPDLTVALWREPVGEWICSHAETRTSDTGIGMAHALLWDRSGRCGFALQSLYLERFAPPEG